MADKLDVHKLNEYKNQSRRARRPFERDWYLNLAFLNGEQYVEFDYVNGKLVEVEQDAAAVRTTRNVCLKISRVERAKILKTVPVPTALPRTDSQKDEMQARMANAYFYFLQEKWNFERRLRSAVFWTVANGNVLLKWHWDPYHKRPDMCVVPIIDAYPDPYARSWPECRWIIHTQFLEEERAKEMYDLSKDDVQASLTTRTETLTSLESRIFTNYGDGEQNLAGVIINEFWMPPNKSYPKGKYMVFTATKVLQETDFPYSHGLMPFTHIGHIERSNSKYYSSVLDDERILQMELNRSESQIVENKNLANGKWWVPGQLQLAQMPNAQPRQILTGEGPPGVAPEFIPVPSYPPWMAEEPERIMSAMQDLAGQHEVSNAGVPGRVESGQAIQLLQETDDSVMKDTIHSMEEAVAQGFAQCLHLYKQFGPPKQMLNVYDENGILEIIELKKEDVNAELRIITQTTTGLPNTVTGRWDRVLNLWQYKVIQDPNMVLELLDMAPVNPDLVPDAIDRNNAIRENRLMMLERKPLIPMRYDNHQVHIREHVKHMKSAEYRALPQSDQDLWLHHIEQHEQLDMELMQKQAELQQMMVPPEQAAEGSTAPPAPNDQGGPAPVA